MNDNYIEIRGGPPDLNGPAPEAEAKDAAAKKPIPAAFDVFLALHEEAISDMANHLPARFNVGLPLVQRKVGSIIAEAKRIETTLIAFATGVDAAGQPVTHNLEAALASWFSAHPAKPPLSETEIATLRWQLISHLAIAEPPCYDVDRMYAAVTLGKVAPLSETKNHLDWLAGGLLHPLQLQREAAALPDADDVHLRDVEIGCLQTEIRARMCEVSRGGTDPSLTRERATQLRGQVLSEFVRHLQTLEESGLPPGAQAFVRAHLFGIDDERPRLIDEPMLQRLLNTG